MGASADVTATRTVAVIGNPNSGKTTLFNALTGLRQKVGNYPGVTVEKKEGRLLFPDGNAITLLDLPGTYSVAACSPDEQVAVDILFGRMAGTPAPDLVLCVVDATNLERHLYLVSQVIDRGIPLVVALNMIDGAEQAGIVIDVPALQSGLGVPVIPTVASRGAGIPEVRAALRATLSASPHRYRWILPEPVHREWEELTGLLQFHDHLPLVAAQHHAVDLLASENPEDHRSRHAGEVIDHLHRDHQKLDFLGFDRRSIFIESRYQFLRELCTRTVSPPRPGNPSLSDRIDRVVTHPVGGYAVFLLLMAVLFQAMFSWAEIPMGWIGNGFDLLSTFLAGVVPPGDLQDLLLKGAVAGVAAVVMFLPQIAFLFLLLGVLEDSGYMARAALLMDRIMGKVGLHGKSFIPLLSSFACAIPGIMATRTIEHPRDRLATMLVAPLVSCSARLPVYTLLIAAFIPNTSVLGVVSLPALTLLALYLTGLTAALVMALLFKKTLLRAAPPPFIMELPDYRLPSLRSVLIQTWERVRHFLERAGTIILGASIILWFFASYPKFDNASPAQRLEHSFAGQAGRFIEPVIAPLGFDWKIGIGLISSLLQREVFVSTMGTIYNVQADQNGSTSLQSKMREDLNPSTGRPTFTLLTAICLMVYYMLAMQCLSTVAIMRKETNGWTWPLVQIAYMSALAYGTTFLVYRAGILLGLGGV